MRNSIFYDSIRDFLDYNSVNGEIRKTPQDESGQGRFAVLHTVVDPMQEAADVDVGPTARLGRGGR